MKAIDDANMEIDDKQPVDPTLLKDLISKQVNKATKKLTAEITSLCKSLALHSKNTRDHAGVSKKKLAKGGTARGKVKDTSQKSSRS